MACVAAALRSLETRVGGVTNLSIPEMRSQVIALLTKL